MQGGVSRPDAAREGMPPDIGWGRVQAGRGPEKGKVVPLERRGEIHIGTSGWHYRHWSGPFYPPELPADRYLAWYARRFTTVEINNTFYGTPELRTLRSWEKSVPDAFVFSVKAHRFITHRKKLKDAAEPLRNFLGTVRVLGRKRGPLLFQLPPGWNVNCERLAAFLREVPRGLRCAFEFRDPRWFIDAVFDLLRDAGAAFCISHFAGILAPRIVTADFVYIRLHGPTGAYQGRYTDKTLADWAALCREWSREGKDVYCYFDNDEAGYAAGDALRLQALVKGEETATTAGLG